MQSVYEKTRNNLRKYHNYFSALPPWPVETPESVTGLLTPEKDYGQKYGFVDFLTTAPIDGINMWFAELGQYLYDFNESNAFLGSYGCSFEITDVDLAKRTATISFTVTNKTGWESATRIYYPWIDEKRHSITLYNDEDGAIYVQEITWKEKIHF